MFFHKFKSNLTGSISLRQISVSKVEARKLDRSIREILFCPFSLDRCCESLLPVTPVNQALEGYHPWDSRGQNTRGQIYRLYGRPVSCCSPSPSLRVLPTPRILRSSLHTTVRALTYNVHSGGRQDNIGNNIDCSRSIWNNLLPILQ